MREEGEELDPKAYHVLQFRANMLWEELNLEGTGRPWARHFGEIIGLY